MGIEAKHPPQDPGDLAPDEYELLDPDAPWVGNRTTDLYPKREDRVAIRASIHKVLHSPEDIGRPASVVSWLVARDTYVAVTDAETDTDHASDGPKWFSTSDVKLELSRMGKFEVRMAANRGLYSERRDATLETVVGGLDKVIGSRHL